MTGTNGEAPQVTVAEAADQLRCSSRTVRRLLKDGKLSRVKPGYVLAGELDDLTEGDVQTEAETSMARAMAEQRLFFKEMHSAFREQRQAVKDAQELLIEGTRQSYKTLERQNKHLQEQNAELMGSQAEAMGLVGDVLLKQSDIQIKQQESERRWAVTMQGVNAIQRALPHLLVKLGADSKVVDFVSDLAPADANQLADFLEKQDSSKAKAVATLIRKASAEQAAKTAAEADAFRQQQSQPTTEGATDGESDQ